jgi:hypothetical protein
MGIQRIETGKRSDSQEVLLGVLAGLKDQKIEFQVVNPAAPEDPTQDVHFVGKNGGVFERILDLDTQPLKAEPTIQLVPDMPALGRITLPEPIPVSSIRPGTARAA